jgi:5-methylcytosine-specific restriction enzyme subunit McrC
MSIPIQNIYYLLCYAWDKLEEAEPVEVNSDATNELLNLFTKVLSERLKWLLKRGLDRNYIQIEEEIYGIKGKFNYSQTVKQNSLRKHHTVCEFDNFQYDILANKIIKNTVLKLFKTDGIDHILREELNFVFKKLPFISEYQLRISDFDKIKIHRNNYQYDFILKVCLIIQENLLLNENTGKYLFKDFIRDEKAMARLFEAFIRNFYKNETSFKVGANNFKWKFTNISENAEQFLPLMKTDTTIVSPEWKLIIDTKYYKDAFSNSYSKLKFDSSNLYQLFSYLINQEDETEITLSCEGILLYPSTKPYSNAEMWYKKHKIKISFINLNQDWRQIKLDLLNLLPTPIPKTKH